MSQTPVLVVGLDGADRRYVDRFAADLPNLAALRAAGVETTLESTHPPWTGSAWPSMYTGLDPSDHGVYDFFEYRGRYPDEATVVTRGDVEAPAIWNYLTHLGLRSVIVNVPVTHPAEALDGVLLPGYLAPPGAAGFPEGIRDRLEAELGEPYQIYSVHETAEPSSAKIDGYEQLIHHRADAAAALLRTEPWAFAFVQVQKTDAVFHNSTDPEDFRRIYVAADELVGRLLDACPREPNVVICSDHGIGPVTGYSIPVNELLRREGLVEPTRNATAEDAMKQLKEGSLRDDGGATSGSPELNRIARFLLALGITPARLYGLAARLGLEDLAMSLAPDGLVRSLTPTVDWAASAAYVRRESEQGIRINLEGREPDGVVPAERYEALRTDLVQLLCDLETPDGRSAFEYARRREEVYTGPHAEDACDVLFQTRRMNHRVTPKLRGSAMVPIDSYNHKPSGVLIASGPDVDADATVDQLSILDVTPIVFALLGQTVPRRLPGEVPDDLVRSMVRTERYEDVAYDRDARELSDQGEVVERLGALGYL